MLNTLYTFWFFFCLFLLFFLRFSSFSFFWSFFLVSLVSLSTWKVFVIFLFFSFENLIKLNFLILLQTSFQVFGLGNKTYPEYNVMGKQIDQRMSELGAKRIYPLGLGNDDENIEDDFLVWKKGFAPAVCKVSSLFSVFSFFCSISSLFFCFLFFLSKIFLFSLFFVQ